MKLFLLTSLLMLSSRSAEAQQQAKQDSATGVVTIPSGHSVDQTVDRLKSALAAKGVTVFALIDHSGEAEKAGLKLRPTKLLIFGNPKAGTPLMVASPTIAIDLPLKILVWQDDSGKVWLSYNAPAWLADRHHLAAENRAPLAAVQAIAAAAAQ
jgi:uncharacterized protein (DUF302 family)